MAIIIGSDEAGKRLKEVIKSYLLDNKYDVVDVTEERSGYMTRGHNNSRMITMGSEIVGDTLAKNVVKGFVEGKYDG
ncbi:RpiB/LacA/LacB family sugar-phosphate isomerase, partial [Staphylococcus aureus]|nr:RpiB/LacA/LacB family sugar-phosphate isomerase [Staphylococcus aureus]